jgi:hypothetical protein
MTKRLRLNVQKEDARLKKNAMELIKVARKFAPQWNRISNNGRMAIERSTARSLRAATVRVTRTSKRMGEILKWLNHVRQLEIRKARQAP